MKTFGDCKVGDYLYSLTYIINEYTKHMPKNSMIAYKIIAIESLCGGRRMKITLDETYWGDGKPYEIYTSANTKVAELAPSIEGAKEWRIQAAREAKERIFAEIEKLKEAISIEDRDIACAENVKDVFYPVKT